MRSLGMRLSTTALLLLVAAWTSTSDAFVVTPTTPITYRRQCSFSSASKDSIYAKHRHATTTTTTSTARSSRDDDADFDSSVSRTHNQHTKHKLSFLHSFQHVCASALLALSIATTSATVMTATPLPAVATDSTAIVSCLFQKCSFPLVKCILNPNCLANVVCINTCNDRPDETECQIECGNLFENDVVGDFNKCAVSDMSCVPKKNDDGAYPVPPAKDLVPKFDTSFFNGRLYITAGQNPLFDTFDCQVHFFTETEPGTFFGKLNWRIEEPDGEFFTRDAIQRFVQDGKEPAHLINHDNEYLHYEDDWYIVDYELDNNKDGIEPFAFVYYRGNNDAWEGYGGAVVYTRASKLPTSLLPRLREAAKKINFDFDKDFTITDNTCPTQTKGDQLVLREKFAGNVALQSEKQLQAGATRLRGNVVNSVKAQVLFVNKEIGQAQKAFETLSADTLKFEQERAASSAGATTDPRSSSSNAGAGDGITTQ